MRIAAGWRFPAGFRDAAETPGGMVLLVCRPRGSSGQEVASVLHGVPAVTAGRRSGPQTASRCSVAHRADLSGEQTTRAPSVRKAECVGFPALRERDVKPGPGKPYFRSWDFHLLEIGRRPALFPFASSNGSFGRAESVGAPQGRWSESSRFQTGSIRAGFELDERRIEVR